MQASFVYHAIRTAIVCTCLVNSGIGRRIHVATPQALATPHFQLGRGSVPRLTSTADLESSLLGLGLDSSQVRDTVQYVSDRSWPVVGAVARANFLLHGINQSFIDADVGRRLTTCLDYLKCDFRTVYEDKQIVVTDKPFDTYMDNDLRGPRWIGEISLEQHLSASHPEVITENGNVRFCHNLDYATSGILVAAKSTESARMVNEAFTTRSARKLYAAIVFGHPPWEHQSWNASIRTSKRRFKQRISKSGKSASTAVTVGARGVLKLNKSRIGTKATLLWLEPHTGRRHQLRLHSSHAGFGIVGDQTYSQSNHDKELYRMFLHAAALKIPIGGEVLSFEAPFDWFDDFEPMEEVRTPQEWPHVAEALCKRMCEIADR